MNSRIITACAAVAAAGVLAACGSSGTPTRHDGMGSGMPMSPGMSMPGSSTTPSGHGMSSSTGMGGMSMAGGNGLQASAAGYSLHRTGSAPMAGMRMPVTFRIDHGGTVQTKFQPEQTKLMHFYLIRSDLTGFQHLHPSMNPAGTWTVTPAALTPGSYRMYVQFQPPGAADPLVLSRLLTVPGTGSNATTPVPAPATTTTIDGYTITVSGTPTAGTASMLTLRFARGGKPVTDLQPYLDTFAHITAIRAGTLAFAHLHPEGETATGAGGPDLHLHAELPQPGSYRIFIQFQTNGRLHTAQLTVRASG